MKETPVVYLEDGKLKYMSCKYKTKYFEIPVPVQLGSAHGWSNLNTKRIVCTLEPCNFNGNTFEMYIDDAIERNYQNIKTISEMPEIVQYIAGLSPDKVYIDEYFDIEKKCECGKDKHGFANHSDWCDLYEDKV